jgi:DNA-binding NarL/FixJ family response regulator
VISVLLVDDQPVIRDGLKVILEAQEDIQVVAEAADGADAVERAGRLAPDVVLMDVRMPGMDGIEATRLLTAAADGPRVLVLTTFGEDRYVYDALRAGASGFLLKDAQRGELVDAVRTVASGDQVLSSAITRSVIEHFVSRRPPAESGTPVELAELTTRELDVTRLVAEGLSNAEIGAKLFVSPATVKSHVGHILGKVGLRDRIHLVVLAYESGFVDPGRSA